MNEITYYLTPLKQPPKKSWFWNHTKNAYSMTARFKIEFNTFPGDHDYMIISNVASKRLYAVKHFGDTTGKNLRTTQWYSISFEDRICKQGG